MDVEAVRAEGVGKIYGSFVALRGVDLRAQYGEVLALVGPNGAGKSTLLSLVAGLEEADYGEVLVGGGGSGDLTAGNIGYVGEQLALYWPLTVRENLETFGRLAGLRRGDLRREIRFMYERLGLGELRDRRADRLSHGERRRVHTAAGLMGRPVLVILDEPSLGVDFLGAMALVSLVQELAEEGCCVLYATQHLAEVERLGGRVLVLDSGGVVVEGRVRDVVESYGREMVEVVFDRDHVPAELGHLSGAEVFENTVRVSGRGSEDLIGEVIGGLGGGAARGLRGVRVYPEGLEAAFVRMTGRQYGVWK